MPTQSRFSILAACEDPRTLQTYDYLGQVWPLPQTGQMWLEYELLKKPDVAGFFCISTSYRHEPNPILGRHKVIFPMFEFETHDGIEALATLEKTLIDYLGIAKAAEVSSYTYKSLAEKYQVNELSPIEEEKMYQEFGNAMLLTHFPIETSPF